jgi:hypothetical protein
LATLDPDEVGTLSTLRQAGGATELAAGATGRPVARPDAGAGDRSWLEDEVLVFAVRPTWIQITSANGTTLFEGTLNAGDSWTLPESDAPPLAQVGQFRLALLRGERRDAGACGHRRVDRA